MQKNKSNLFKCSKHVLSLVACIPLLYIQCLKIFKTIELFKSQEKSTMASKNKFGH